MKVTELLSLNHRSLGQFLVMQGRTLTVKHILDTSSNNMISNFNTYYRFVVCSVECHQRVRALLVHVYEE